ncbi:MAG: ATP-binding cassette domain-containing protein, partial [Synergistaceae bacterium]|nr:ATP-binding cassette domain-containing protein [Synergistaceae bacterium]
MKDVSFFVRKGERIAILGHNGSGKSTLVKILGGLVEPDEGSCLVEGVDMQDMEFRDLRGKLGMVFQDPENQIVAAMVEDDVAFAPENQGLPSDEIQQRVDSALARVNMTHKQDSSVEALSGGEKQRVALAGALAAKVECLILDEATAMLDPKGRMDIEKTLREIHGEGMTIIQVTHQIEAENFDDIERVIVLSKGGVIWNDETSEFWSKAEELGFNVPDEFKIKKFFADSKVDFATADFSHVKPIFSSEPRHEDAGHEVKFSVEGLSFRYDEKNFALKNLDVKIYAGQWLSIIGRTGSGKSTFVQHLNAL